MGAANEKPAAEGGAAQEQGTDPPGPSPLTQPPSSGDAGSGDTVDVEAGQCAASAPSAAAGCDERVVAAEGEEEEETPLVLVLLGRVGAGKSSTANSLCASLKLELPFEARRSACAVTGACRAEVGPIATRQVLVLDTPGLGDAALTAREVHNEIRRGITELAPAGAEVCALLVLSLQSRVGEDDFAIVDGLKEGVFGNGMLASSLVVWTHADALDGEGLEGYLQGAGDRLREFLGEVAGGSVAIDNRRPPPGDGSTSPEVDDLVRKASSVAGKCYLVKQREPRTYGRRTARRQRQLEAGLLKRPAPSTGGCCVS